MQLPEENKIAAIHDNKNDAQYQSKYTDAPLARINDNRHKILITNKLNTGL